MNPIFFVNVFDRESPPDDEDFLRFAVGIGCKEGDVVDLELRRSGGLSPDVLFPSIDITSSSFLRLAGYVLRPRVNWKKYFETAHV